MTWWRTRNDDWRTAAQQNRDVADMLGTGELELLSAQLIALLDEVESVFAEIGADTPGWEDPHREPDGTSRAIADEEYSRCPDAEKYLILWSRAEAWIRVLTGRGWARETIHVDPAEVRWLFAPSASLHRTTVLRPSRIGAQALVIARTAPDDAPSRALTPGADALLPGLVLGLGEPAMPVETLPQCGCDACDRGSPDLLEMLDIEILSIVDGSSEVAHTPSGCSKRTSFGAEGGTGEGRPDLTASVTAGPWAEGWQSRRLTPAAL